MLALSRTRTSFAAVLLAAATTGACALGEESEMHHPLDFEEPAGDGKADGALSRFFPGHLVSDRAYFDQDALSAAEIQQFLEMTPYGKRSFLADEQTEDRSVAEAIHGAARRHRVNPLVLLATLQKESGLVSRSVSPGRARVDYALGCGCPDNRGCLPAYRGLDKQIDCAAEHLQSYADALEEGRPTLTGLFPGDSTVTSEGAEIVLANRATAILYTYTPWVMRGTGGNWLFWNIWRRYSDFLGYQDGLELPFNEGWIGGACEGAEDCFFEGALCIGGLCSASCEGFCPDRRGAFATTLCVDGGGGEGRCVARCDLDLSESGCGPDQVCRRRERFNDGSAAFEVCVPR